MAGQISKIEGINETVRMLEQAPRDVVARGYLKALGAGIQVFRDALEVVTPIKAEATGGILRPGELKASLVTQVTLDSQFRGGIAEVGFGKNSAVAGWIEFGHRQVGHKPGKKLLGETAAHPFMRPIFDTTADAAVDAFAAALESELRKAF